MKEPWNAGRWADAGRARQVKAYISTSPARNCGSGRCGPKLGTPALRRDLLDRFLRLCGGRP